MKKNLHTIIEEYLKNLVAQNIGTKNYKLPTETQLMLKFNASRITVRKALSSLENDGAIYKIKGKGSFIKEGNSVKYSKTDRIAFVYPNSLNAHPREIARGIVDYFEPRNINVTMFESDNSGQKENELLYYIAKNDYRGVILMPIDGEYYNPALLQMIVNNYPIILVDRQLIGLNVACVLSDHRKIGRLATEKLLSKRTKIAYISRNTATSSIDERLKGYKEALRNANNNDIFVFSFGKYDGNDYYGTLIDDLAKFFKANDIDGVVCNSGYNTAITIRAFSLIGKQLENDYDIVCIDKDSDIIEKTLNKRIPCVVQNSALVGKTAAANLFDLIYNNVKQEDSFVPIIE